MASKKHYLVFVLVIVSIALLILPVESTTVPEWRVRLVDEHGLPWSGRQVREVWKDYSVELGNGTHVEDRWTDSDGYVAFPKRTIRAGLLKRIVFGSWARISTLFHGSVGKRAYVMPAGGNSVDFDQTKTQPQQVVVPRLTP